MAKSAILAVRIVSDAKDAVSGIGKATGAVGGLVKAAGVAAIAYGGAKLVEYGTKAVKMAGDLEQSQGAIKTVFKGSSGQMLKWSEQAATAVGLTKNEFNELGTLIGTQLKNGGTAMDQLAPKTNQLITLGADLASMFGGTSKEAVEALSSALKGERDPIERYGVSLTQAKIDAEAAALGFKKVGGSLSEEASQAATLSLIMKQTADAHGNFAKESNTLQGQQARAKAQWDNIITTLGTLLLPILTQVFGFINTNVLPVVKQFTDSLGANGAQGALTGTTGAMAPLQEAFKQVTPLIPQFAGLFKQIAPLAVSLVSAVVPLVAELASELGPTLVDLAKEVVPPFIEVLREIVPVIKILAPIVSQTFQVAGAVIKTTLGFIAGLLKTVTAAMRGDWSGAWNAMKDTALNLVRNINQTVERYFGMIPGSIMRGLGDLSQLLTGAGQAIMNGLLGGLQSMWGNVQNFVGGIADWIAQHKGPISYDRRLLTPAGQAIMAGLIGGLKDGMTPLDRQLKAITGRILGIDGLAPSVSLGVAGDGSSGAQLSAAGRGNTYITVNVEGALDPVAVGRQIESVLTQAMRRTGRLSNGEAL
ncbi:hypothetical protein [Arthrobacter sp. RCC_34]|uniref:phage tail protein n=1 Tax=Arthrobacter sp. RCC_34 TaxID=3239230 RepID=UPI003524963B